MACTGLERAAQGAFGHFGLFGQVFQRQRLIQILIHIPDDPGDGLIQPGGAGGILLPGIGFAQDQRQHLGQVNEIAQGIVAAKRAKQQVKQKFHPPYRIPGGETADAAFVQGIKGAIFPLEMHPHDAPGVRGVCPVAMSLHPGNAKGFVFLKPVTGTVHFYGALTGGAAQENVFLSAFLPLPEMISGMGKEPRVGQVQTPDKGVEHEVGKGLRREDDHGLAVKTGSFRVKYQFHKNSIAECWKIVHLFL